ncbi:hypothetical protein SAMN05444166_2763 [Singulisphaera sp. GP187]|nr:hypothetical protein SAMN05444166_2763 [Singulisphaera sp. GP187]
MERWSTYVYGEAARLASDVCAAFRILRAATIGV